MANEFDLLAQAAQGYSMLPDANTDAAWVPPAIPTAPVQAKMDSLSSLGSEKQASVANASSAKQQALNPQQAFLNAVGAATGKGADTASELELDLRNLTPTQLYGKYGKQAGDLLDQQARGTRDLLKLDTQGNRTGVELWDDFNVNVAGALGSTVGGVAALGAGLINDDLGVGAANLLGDFNKFMQGSQSDRLQNRQRVKEAKDTLDDRDNLAQRAKDKETDGDLIAGLKYVGREVISSLDNATDDSATFGAGVNNALGSFIGVAPVRAALAAGTAGRLGTVSAIAATESGGSYAQIADEISNRSHEQLLKESQPYAELIRQGTPQDEAKAYAANQTGLTAAAFTAPAAIAAGRLVKGFEGNVAALGSGKQLFGNIAHEGLEETLQSGAGQLAQNIAERQIANNNKDIAEGVGRQAAEGGLYGVGMSTALGIPSVARSAAGKVQDVVNDRLAGITAANEKASPISDEKIAEAAAQAQASAPVAAEVLRTAVDELDIAPEAKAEAVGYVDSLMAASNYDPAEAPAQFQEFLSDVPNRVGAIQRMAEIVNSAEEDSNDQLRAGFYLNEMLSDYIGVVNSDPDALSALADGSQAKEIVNQYQNLLGTIGNTPKVVKALQTIAAVIEKSEAKQVDVTPETLATPEGQQEVQDVINTASLAPEKVDLPTAEKILYQVSQGNLEVTPRQKAALDSTVALLRAVQAADQAAKANGQASSVSLNITSEEGEKGKSLLQHAKGIMSAWKTGDRNLAADRLASLKDFAQGLSNKVAALNSHFAAGNPNADGLSYEVYVGGKPITSASKVAVRTGKATSIQFAQKVAAEAKLLADAYNGLVQSFPDLGADQLVVTSLASELVGAPAEVAAKFAKPVAPVAEAKDTPAKANNPNYSKQVWNSVVVYDAFDGMKPGDWKVFENGFEDTRAFNYVTPSGVQIAGDFQLDGDQFLHFNIASKDGKASASPKVLKTILNNLQKDFPEVKRVHGFRISGVRANNPAVTEVKFSIKNGRWVMERPSTPTEPVKEVAATEEVLDEPVVEDKPAEPKLKGLSALFPNMLGGETGPFTTSFQIPKKQRTRTIGTENPLSVIKDALKDSAAFTAFLGSSSRGELTQDIARNYRNMFRAAEDFLSELDDRLQSYLDSPYGKTNSTTIRQVLAGTKILTGTGQEFMPELSTRGKALALTENVDGEVVYNQELIEGAVLAALQWFLVSDQYGADLDAAAVSETYGIPEEAVNPDTITRLSAGMTSTEAKRSLATKIRNYWGLQNNPDGYIGLQEGIPEAIAAELLEVMIARGWATTAQVTLTEADGLPALLDNKPNVKTIDQVIPEKLAKDSPLRAMPEAIERAVMLEPEETRFIGEDAIPPVATEQLRNPGVENTAQQLEMLKKEQATPYYVNPFMAGFYAAIGRDSVVDLFGAGKVDPATTNRNHAESLEGKNKSVAAAFDHLQGLLAEIQNIGDVLTTPVRYAYNMTRVNRMQMLGKYNPQSNKLVREAILPTFSTLDLSNQNSEDYGRFILGVAQMIGDKVHKKSRKASRAKVEGWLNGPLAPAVDALRNWLNGFDGTSVIYPKTELDASTVTVLKDAFAATGEALTPMSLHAVMEYARYLNAEDKSSFRTAAYVEADGVTNGPINAMVLFTTGLFKGEWLRNIAKGGLFFNRPGETVNTHNEFEDSDDLYQATTSALDTNLTALRKDLEFSNPEGAKQLENLLRVMDLFFGKDLNIVEGPDGNYTLELNRGIAKNPLTITIYGSGANGIAAKMTKTLVDALYERMSQVAKASAKGERSFAIAMFGPQSVDQADAEAKLKQFGDAFRELTGKRAGVTKDGALYFKKSKNDKPAPEFDPIKFTIEGESLDNLRSNMRYLFVEPMREAIQAAVGPELLSTAELLRQATQVQSIVLEAAFEQEVQAALDKKAQDPNWRAGQFLTRKELQDIQKKLEFLSPYIKTENQNFYIAGSQKSDVRTTEFARSLTDTFNTPAFINGPKDAGVSGIPFLNIGSGDGLMMQLASTMKDAITGTLKIFDGMNMPLDQIEKGSEQANEAVFNTWTQNPLAAVYESFDKFLSDAKLTGFTPKAQLALSKALFGLQSGPVSEDTLMDAMQSLRGQLNNAQLSIEARHRVMKRVNVTVDQMAAVGVPFNSQGDLELTGTDPDSLAEQLNVYYLAEEAALRAEQPTATVDKAIASLGSEQPSGVVTLSAADIKNLPVVLNAEQNAVMAEVINSLAANDYTVVMGTAEQIAAYNADAGLPGVSATPTGEVRGYTNADSKTIYLLNPSTETFLHELIHAATFDAVNAHYNGVTNKSTTGAIARIEQLMTEFLAQGSELTQTSQSLNSAFNDVTAAIQGHLSAGRKAEGLNEFMAWTLTNPSLVRIAQKQQVSKLAKARDAVISFIKSLFNIKATAGKDLFSNLLFNSAILMQNQVKLAQRFAARTLFQNSVYGDNPRLAQINEALNKTMGRYLQEPVTARSIDQQSVQLKALQNSFDVAQSFVGHGFNMTGQALTTFKTIVTALSTEANIDPNALAAAQQLYSHVMKNLSVESFMVNPDSNDPNDRAQAAEKFDVLSGKYLVARDSVGRSSLLPAFLALATVDDGFRQILSDVPLPKSAANTAGTVDALLENFGNNMIDKLGKRMAGLKKPSNVQEAIDMLNNRIADIIEQQDSYIETLASKPGTALDKTNDVVVGAMNKLANEALKVAKRTQRNGAGRVERAVGGIAAGFAALIDQNTGEAVAEATMAAVSKTDMWNGVQRLISDLVGRTGNNASIYDMIKAVRSVVQRTRQQYREDLPQTLASRFSRELTKEEKASLHKSMAKTDLAALGKDALKLAADPAAAIKGLEADLSSHVQWKAIQQKAKQLANFMVTVVAGPNLLRNAEAVARLLGEGYKYNGPLPDINKLDRLITLYAVDSLNQEDKNTLATLAKEEAAGMQFTLDYLRGQRAEEKRKTNGRAKYNAYKGYVPDIRNEGVTLLVANDSEYSKLIGKSYQRVADYSGSRLEPKYKAGYYFVPVAARATFEQGILQNVHQTAGGVDLATGYSLAQNAGRITDPVEIKRIAQRLHLDAGPEALTAVYGENGDIIALERSLDPAQVEKTLGDQDLHKAIGIWRGRQVEEGFAQAFNEQLVNNLADMYERDIAQNPDNAKQYVNVFETKDPVIRDAAKLMNFETRDLVAQRFGGEGLFVRKDLLEDVLGYRSASIGDAWTGTSRWSPETLKTIQNTATVVFGNQAYKTLLTAERTIQSIVSDTKVLIVVKSVVVPVANLMSNMFQLAARGVPLRDMAKAFPAKTAEVEAYTKSLLRRIEAEAELRAAQGDPRLERKLKTEIQAINDSHRRMGIWPLIEAGEFSGISDAGLTRNEINLTSGRLQAYMEQAAQKLPGWGSTIGRYALVTKDTALYQGLQKAVEYGDFLAKSVMYDDLVKRKGMSQKDALARITEEFINYDRLPGRSRGALENLGLLWFYNFKIRSVKVAMSMIRNNPVHTLLATLAPTPDVFGGVGLPTADNMITKLADGTLSYSIGPEQGLNSAMLNPWINLTQ